jgi:hypothetical protein
MLADGFRGILSYTKTMSKTEPKIRLRLGMAVDSPRTVTPCSPIEIFVDRTGKFQTTCQFVGRILASRLGAISSNSMAPM